MCFHAITSVVTNEAKKLSFVEILEDLYRLCLFVFVQCFIAFYEEFVEILFTLIAAFSDLLCINDLCWIAWIAGAERVAF